MMCCRYKTLLILIINRIGSKPSSRDNISLVTWLEQSNILRISISSICSSFRCSHSVMLYHTSLQESMAAQCLIGLDRYGGWDTDTVIMRARGAKGGIHMVQDSLPDAGDYCLFCNINPSYRNIKSTIDT